MECKSWLLILKQKLAMIADAMGLLFLTILSALSTLIFRASELGPNFWGLHSRPERFCASSFLQGAFPTPKRHWKKTICFPVAWFPTVGCWVRWTSPPRQ